MCELLRNARSLAKTKGLNPSELRCSPEIKALCVDPRECALIIINDKELHLPQPDMVEKFYQKLEKRNRIFSK